MLRTRRVDQNDCRMFRACSRTHQGSRQLNVTARETHVFTVLNFDAPRDTRRCTVVPPGERGDPSGAIALKVDAGLDLGGNRPARSCEEAVAMCRIQRSKLARFI